MSCQALHPIVVITCLALTFAACGSDDALPTGPSGPLGENRIKLEAVATNHSGTCPELSFRLGTVTVRTAAGTDFQIACTDIVNGAAVEVNGAEITDSFLFAHEVERDDDALGDADFDVRGTIESLADVGTCTATGGRRVVVRGLRFFVSPFFTEFKDIPQGCAGLAPGLLIRAKGRLPPSEPLRADEVEHQ